MRFRVLYYQFVIHKLSYDVQFHPSTRLRMTQLTSNFCSVRISQTNFKFTVLFRLPFRIFIHFLRIISQCYFLTLFIHNLPSALRIASLFHSDGVWGGGRNSPPTLSSSSTLSPPRTVSSSITELTRTVSEGGCCRWAVLGLLLLLASSPSASVVAAAAADADTTAFWWTAAATCERWMVRARIVGWRVRTRSVFVSSRRRTRT